jgi:transposase-like protein
MAQPVPAAERDRILAELLVRRAAGETFAAIAALPGFPSRPTLRKWLRRRPDLHVPPLRRPSVRWSQALADEICDLFEVLSLREICEQPGMPDRKTLHAWRHIHPAFAVRLEAIRCATRQPPTGRRSTYCELVADDIVDAVFEAGSIAAACRGPDFPAPRTVWDWVHAHPEFARQIAIAYEMAKARRLAPLLDDMPQWLLDIRTRAREP